MATAADAAAPANNTGTSRAIFAIMYLGLPPKRRTRQQCRMDTAAALFVGLFANYGAGMVAQPTLGIHPLDRLCQAEPLGPNGIPPVAPLPRRNQQDRRDPAAGSSRVGSPFRAVRDVDIGSIGPDIADSCTRRAVGVHARWRGWGICRCHRGCGDRRSSGTGKECGGHLRQFRVHTNLATHDRGISKP